MFSVHMPTKVAAKGVDSIAHRTHNTRLFTKLFITQTRGRRDSIRLDRRLFIYSYLMHKHAAVLGLGIRYVRVCSVRSCVYLVITHRVRAPTRTYVILTVL